MEGICRIVTDAFFVDYTYIVNQADQDMLK